MKRKKQILRVYQMLPGVKTLGPFERFALWTQGCNRRCPGCISPKSRPFYGGKERLVEEIAKEILKYDHEGITISGGEPFLQASALCTLIDLLRSAKDIGVILYTGYTLEELHSSKAPEKSEELLKRIDLLIDGPYISELNDDNSLRGSSNQQIYPLTVRYKDYLSLYGIPNGRKTELRVLPDGFFIVGIPTKTVALANHLGYYDNQE